MLTRKGSDRPLIVLQSFRKPRRTSNPYLWQLTDALEQVVVVRTFTWRRALLGRYDVLHLHWPELLVLKSSVIKTFAANVLFRALLMRIRFGRAVLVRTIHNAAPHEARSRLVMTSLARADSATTSWISMAEGAGSHPGGRHDVIPHGHYKDWFVGQQRMESIPGRIVFFGLVRAYKGVDRLVEAFHDLPDAAVSLRIIGKPDPRSLGDRLQALAGKDPRISFRLEYVDDDALVCEITRSELVVLPYHEMLNSGALILALSLGRPVLVPFNAVTTALSNEVGPGWVHQYKGRLTSEALSAVARYSGDVTAQPNLSAREWRRVADDHAASYRAAVRHR